MGDHDTDAPKAVARRPLNVACSIDTDVPAVFYCSRCKKPFCEDCIGRESAGITLCLQCASVEESIEDAAQRRPAFAFARTKQFLVTLLGVAASVAIAVNAYVLYSNRVESDMADGIEQRLSPQLEGIVACRADLEVLAAEAAGYRRIMDRPPASLEELRPILDPKVRTEDPVSHAPYIVESDHAGNIVVRCPTPEAHGVASITAVPGKPARLTYLNAAKRP